MQLGIKMLVRHTHTQIPGNARHRKHLQNYNFAQYLVLELIVPQKSHYKTCTDTQIDRDSFNFCIHSNLLSLSNKTIVTVFLIAVAMY